MTTIGVDALARAIEALEFDTVFRIEDGRVIECPEEWAPDVMNDATDDVWIDPVEWRCLTGLTGQYGYRGAVMHPDEYVGAGIAEHLAEYAADDPDMVFALVVVYSDEDGGDGDDGVIGWAIAYRDGESS